MLQPRFRSRTVRAIGLSHGVQQMEPNPRVPLAGGLLWLVVTAVLVALCAALIVPAPPAARPEEPVPKAPDPVPSPAMVLPWVQTASTPPVQARLSRGVPPSVLASADLTPVPWAPGLRLHKASLQGPWPQYRALVEDLTTKDLRSYAIGDLLPHGSLLVGISTGAAQVLVADVELIELRTNGKLRSLHDFRAAYEARPLPRAPELAKAYVEGAQDTLQALLDDDPAVVQQAIDELIAAGEPAVELMLPFVDSDAPVVPYGYVFGEGPAQTPSYQGDIVVGVLQVITQQSFGDVFGPSGDRAGREQVARAWRRWWGL